MYAQKSITWLQEKTELAEFRHYVAVRFTKHESKIQNSCNGGIVSTHYTSEKDCSPAHQKSINFMMYIHPFSTHTGTTSC